jgi:hypothetical protein
MRQTVHGRRERLLDKPDTAAAPQRKRGARNREKAMDARIDRLYGKRCSGLRIDVMDIPKIFALSRAAIRDNPDITDEALGDMILALTQLCKK